MKVTTLPVGELKANCYIIETESKNAVAVDIGGEPEKIIGFLKQNGLTLKKIILTHGHFDHIGGVSEVQSATGAEVYVHELDGEKLESEVASLAAFASTVKFNRVTDYNKITDGDIISQDEVEFKVLHTPGHTAGSVCYLSDKYIFSGDTLFKCTCGRTDFPDGSMKDMLESMKKLKEIDGNFVVFTGHDESTSLDYERKYNMYMKENAYEDFI